MFPSLILFYTSLLFVNVIVDVHCRVTYFTPDHWHSEYHGKLLSSRRDVFAQSETRSTLVRRIWGRRH